ncbi:OLC1v1021338C1 [Oldenlandia corymbosa var. corymbosa]|uniref:OLC1v1021338C1 n=1 Tax=Oldenlandia corymbosa var. corymbosa TaxID=529605 RepID=A0AAV1BVF5_OLDCO|nr:OLC1v1021338C1 [Oldenlandia corymbosa var. corymbosa]
MNPMDLSKKRKTEENGGAYSIPGDLNSTLPPLSSQLTPEDIAKILDPFSKEQLLPILRAAILRHPDVLEAVRAVADSDPSQRKLFIRGLGWETNTDKLRSVFSAYGELDEAIVINDKNTGKSKGYGFVTFKHIDAAILALKEPNKKIDGRITVTQLAAAGNSGNSQSTDVASRKIYVGNIPFEISSEKLLSHFSMYGEIEEGPLGFDKQTGKAKGFAFFVFKTEDGARKSLVDPTKTIDGHQLVCKLATDNKKMKQQQQAPNVGPGVPNANPDYGYPPYNNYPAPGIQPQQQPPHTQPGMIQQPQQYQPYVSGPNSGDYGPNMYRMPPSSIGVQTPGGFPDGGNFNVPSSYPSQMNQQPGTGPRVPPGGMYQVPHAYYGGTMTGVCVSCI